MFTGLIRDLGTVEAVERQGDGARIQIATGLASDLELGDSLAVNGVCLTVETRDSSRVGAAAVEETMRRSTLGSLRPGQRVNLEPALRAGDAMGGHIVQGHVDGVLVLEAYAKKGLSHELRFGLPPTLARYVAEKGSVALDGVSLTVAQLKEQSFTVAVIPHTWGETTMQWIEAGQKVNFEVDVLAKYVERMLSVGRQGGGQMTLERLEQLGY